MTINPFFRPVCFESVSLIGAVRRHGLSPLYQTTGDRAFLSRGWDSEVSRKNCDGRCGGFACFSGLLSTLVQFRAAAAPSAKRPGTTLGPL